MRDQLPPIINIQSVKDVQAQRFLLDFIQGIDLDTSLDYLGVTINESDISIEDYTNYLYNYLNDELDLILATIAENEPRTWIPVTQSIREQQKEPHQPLRICIHLQYVNDAGSVIDSIVYELVLIYRVDLDRYVLITFNQNYDSVVHYATNEYLNPELGVPMQPTLLKS